MSFVLPSVLSVIDGDPPRVPVVFDCPHSGRVYPADFRPALPVAVLRPAEDRDVDDLFSAAPDHGAALVVAHFPRVFVDANRAADDIDPELLSDPWPGPIAPSGKALAGMGVVWRLAAPGMEIHGRRLHPSEVAARIAAYHAPYHAALARVLDARLAEFGRVFHFDCHSMPARNPNDPAADCLPPFADIVLGDRDGTTAGADFVAAVEDCLTGQGFRVARNDPYKGVELVRAFGDPAHGRHSLQIEINRHLYMNETTQERSAGYAAIKAAMTRLIAATAAFAAA